MQHPELSLCQQKEPHHFSKSSNWESGLAKYHAHFSPQGGQLCFEASTSYSFWPEYAETSNRLFAYNPDLKFIYLLRHPVERIVSHYLHRLRRGKVLRRPRAEVLGNPIYVNRSRYGTQIRPYLDLFPSEKVLILIFEEYIESPMTTFQRVAEFLDVSPQDFAAVETTPKHVSQQHGFTGERFLGAIQRRLGSAPSGTPRKTLFERVIYRIEFSRALRDQL